MRKVVVSEYVSLDGVMEAPENWHFPFLNEEMEKFFIPVEADQNGF